MIDECKSVTFHRKTNGEYFVFLAHGKKPQYFGIHEPRRRKDISELSA